jgi:D-serine deaminase-like pyridoxal phosphate-dependent protein
MNDEVLQGMYEERIGPGAKGMPLDAVGGTVANLVSARRPLFAGGFSAPVMVLHADALEHNLTLMARYCSDKGVELAPHGKTTLAPQLFARQLAHGASGITAASAAQLRLYRRFGVPRVLLANQLVDRASAAWLRAELETTPDFEVTCYVDSSAGVDLLAAEFTGRSGARPLPVLVEVGHPGGRTGCRFVSQAEEVARAVVSAPGLRLAGVAAFEGTIGPPDQPGVRNRVRDFLADVRRVGERLVATGLVPGELVLSAGGSAYFDLVVAAFRDGWPDDRPVRVVLRSGCYVVHETGPPADATPFARSPYQGKSLRPALELWGQVLSRPEPELALLSFGKRDASFDTALPTPVRLRRASATAAEPFTGVRIDGLNDQHAYLRLPGWQRLEVGDWVGCGLAHPCTAFDKWRLIPVVVDDVVVDFVRTFF